MLKLKGKHAEKKTLPFISYSNDANHRIRKEKNDWVCQVTSRSVAGTGEPQPSTGEAVRRRFLSRWGDAAGPRQGILTFIAQISYLKCVFFIYIICVNK